MVPFVQRFQMTTGRVDNRFTAVRYQEDKQKEEAVAPKGYMRSPSVQGLTWEAENV